MTHSFGSVSLYGNFAILMWIAFYWSKQGKRVRMIFDNMDHETGQFNSVLLLLDDGNEFKAVTRDNITPIVNHLKQLYGVTPPDYIQEAF